MDASLQGRYDGGCRNGLADGFGRATGSAVYEGEFVAGQKAGFGRLTLPNGDQYVGHFRRDMREGLGAYHWLGKGPEQGNTYVGEYLSDRRHGHGVLQMSNGDRYDGQWLGDVRQGPTAMEQRVAQYQNELDRVMVTGARVCRGVQLGIAMSQELAGVIERRSATVLHVRLSQAGEGYEAGQLLADESIVDWRLCS